MNKRGELKKFRPILKLMLDHWEGESRRSVEDSLAMEEPFEIRLGGRSLAAIMRTPDQNEDQELAAGFLLSEGVIADPAEILNIRRAIDPDGLPEENIVEVELENYSLDPEARFERRFTVSSSCGLCGKNSIAEVCRHLPPLPADNFKIKAETLYSLPEKLRQQQAVFESTGGLHAAGLFDREGNLLLLREDVGRHNAVDKLVGRSALDKTYPLSNHILMVSGRASFEIVQKAIVSRIPVLAAVSAPSSLAVELAEESGITLIGFLRGRTMNVYTGGERLI